MTNQSASGRSNLSGPPPRRRPAPAPLAGGAAEILERDYGIDAGEVLSMNVDTVETVDSSSKVDASAADEILGRNGKTATWGTYDFSYSSTPEKFNSKGTPPTTSDVISDMWAIADRDVKAYATDSEGNIKRDESGAPIIQDSKESVVFLKDIYNSSFQFLRNDAEWQDPSEYSEVTYRTVIGGDTALQTMFEGGVENYDACGEAWWFFKLNEKNTEGYAICLDNHGWKGCGVFVNRNWHQLYVCHYDYDNPTSEGNNVSILKTLRISPLQVCPRYEITVHEKDGKATITIDPDELNAPYSYLGKEDNTDAWTYNGYYIGYAKGSEHTDATNEAITNGIQESGFSDATARTVSTAHFKNKDSYDWDWPGATQDAYTCTIDLSDSILKEKTTQAFSAYWWNGIYFANNSVDVTKTVTKSFGDIVYEPAWTDGALHMLINMDGAADRTMLGGDGGVESSTRLLER